MRSWRCRVLPFAATLFVACAARPLERADEAPIDASVVVARDLAATLVDAAAPFDGPKRHLGEPCDADAACLSGTCLLPETTRGQWDHVCGQVCDRRTPCLEGTCVTYDYDVYWCVRSCDFQQHSTDCLPKSFLCCQGGPRDVCVARGALTCSPL